MGRERVAAALGGAVLVGPRVAMVGITSNLPEALPGTRARILDAAAELFGRNGYTGTGIKAILAASRSPYGSLYHFLSRTIRSPEPIRIGGRAAAASLEAALRP